MTPQEVDVLSEKSKDRAIAVRLHENTIKRLDEIAYACDRSRNWIICALVEYGLEKHAKRQIQFGSAVEEVKSDD